MALRQMPASEFARLVSSATDQSVSTVAVTMHGTSRTRRHNEPDPGAREELHFDAKGVRIRITARSAARESLISWRQVTDWIRPGATPARQHLLEQAQRTQARYRTFADGFAVTGQQHVYRAAIEDLDAIIAAVITATIDAALEASPADWATRRSGQRRTPQPQMPGASTLFADTEPGADDLEAEASEPHREAHGRFARQPADPYPFPAIRAPARRRHLPSRLFLRAIHPARSPSRPWRPRHPHRRPGGPQDVRPHDRWTFHKNGENDPLVTTVPLPPTQHPAQPCRQRAALHTVDRPPHPEVPDPDSAIETSATALASAHRTRHLCAPRSYPASGARGAHRPRLCSKPGAAPADAALARRCPARASQTRQLADQAMLPPARRLILTTADQHLQDDPVSQQTRPTCAVPEEEPMADKTRRNVSSSSANGYGDPDPDLAELIAALTETANAKETHGLISHPTSGAGTAAIKAAFAELWQALDLAGSGQEPSHRTLRLRPTEDGHGQRRLCRHPRRLRRTAPSTRPSSPISERQP